METPRKFTKRVIGFIAMQSYKELTYQLLTEITLQIQIQILMSGSSC